MKFFEVKHFLGKVAVEYNTMQPIKAGYFRGVWKMSLGLSASVEDEFEFECECGR